MRTIGNLAALFGAVLSVAGAGYAAPAAAQATRTWVSGVGDDVNPCSRTAPCKTFAGAISKTAAGGQINCLDPGGFGTVTITKSIAIQCDHTEGGVLASSVNGVVVNAAATDIVYLSGLDIHGGVTGLNGVRFLAGGSLHIQNSTIRRFNGPSSGQGVLFVPSAASALYITNTIIGDNGSASGGGGVLIKPSGTGSAKVVLDNVQIVNNANAGFKVDTTGNTGTGVLVQIERSVISGSSGGVSVTAPPGTTTASVQITDSLVSGNVYGLVATNPNASIRAGNTTITGNTNGVTSFSSGVVNSYGDNRLNGNTANGAFTGALLPLK